MKRLRSLPLILTCVAFLPSMCLAAYPGANGKILYLDRNTDVGAHLVVVNQDGTGSVTVTAGLNMEISRASWSPDGSRIAFTGFPLDSPLQEGRLYVTDANGTSIQEISITPARDAALPTWSPDGTRIAFAGLDDSSGGSERAIFVIGIDGLGLVRLSHSGEEYSYFSLAWSPRGDSLLFAGLSLSCPSPPCSASDADAEVYVMAVASGVITRLTTNTVLEESVSWSPDGLRIVFDRIPQSDPSCKIIVLDLTTSQETDVSHNQGVKRCFRMPTWSPDGGSIAYVTSSRGNLNNQRVVVGDALGNGRRDVTHGPLDFNPDWQPVP